MADASNPYADVISKHCKHVLDVSQLSVHGATRKQGKVRDIYDLGDKLLLITTDRVSAFDRVLASVPFKGQVLNQISLWWFRRTEHIVPNHILSSPDACAILAKRCTVFPIEFVVRGYLTGTTDTSIWTHYAKGERSYCGHSLPDGMHKHQALPKPLVTPTTKEEAGHDALISRAEIIEQKRMSAEDYDACCAYALSLFEFGQQQAAKHGLLLADTKYEFGKDADGRICIVDEIHTPDSSRYWIASSYAQRLAANQAPESIDKDILRTWYREHCDPYKDANLPEAPIELIVLLSLRYIELYERITGEKFAFGPLDQTPAERLTQNLRNAGLLL